MIHLKITLLLAFTCFAYPLQAQTNSDDFLGSIFEKTNAEKTLELNVDYYFDKQGGFLKEKWEKIQLDEYDGISIKGKIKNQAIVDFIIADINKAANIHIFDPGYRFTTHPSISALENIDAVALTLNKELDNEEIEDIWTLCKHLKIKHLKLRNYQRIKAFDCNISFQELLSQLESFYVVGFDISLPPQLELYKHLKGIHVTYNSANELLYERNFELIAKLNSLKSLGIRCTACIKPNLKVISNLRQLTYLEIHSNFSSNYIKEKEIEASSLSFELDVSKFKNLKNLKFKSHPNFNNTIKGLPALSQLEKLSLEDVKLDHSENDINSLSKLIELKAFNTSHKSLEFLFRSPNITNLELSDRHVYELPASFEQMSKLHSLHIREMDLVNFPKSSKSTQTLENIFINGSKLCELPAWFGELKYLKRLDLHNNKLLSLPDKLELESLEYMNLSNNYIKEIPSDISNSIELQELDLSSNRLSTLPNSFKPLKKLHTINLSNPEEQFEEKDEVLSMKYRSLNDITSLPISLAKSKSLRSLDLSRNIQVQQALIDFLPKCQNKNLEVTLDLCNIDDLDDVKWKTCELKHLEIRSPLLKTIPKNIEDAKIDVIIFNRAHISEHRRLMLQYQNEKISLKKILEHEDGIDLFHSICFEEKNHNKTIKLYQSLLKKDKRFWVSRHPFHPYLTALFKTGKYEEFVNIVDEVSSANEYFGDEKKCIINHSANLIWVKNRKLD